MTALFIVLVIRPADDVQDGDGDHGSEAMSMTLGRGKMMVTQSVNQDGKEAISWLLM